MEYGAKYNQPAGRWSVRTPREIGGNWGELKLPQLPSAPLSWGARWAQLPSTFQLKVINY